jgi:hypothetical protein
MAGGGVSFLLDAKETITHNQAKMRFPAAVHPVLPAAYQIEYDGVIAPAVNNYKMLGRSDFNAMQLFASGGFRSDLDLTDHWRISFDLRVNFGLLEPRSDAYLQRLKANETLYDIPGSRKDIVATFNIGVSRYLDIDKKDKNRNKGKTSNQRSKPSRSGGKRKPRG